MMRTSKKNVLVSLTVASTLVMNSASAIGGTMSTKGQPSDPQVRALIKQAMAAEDVCQSQRKDSQKGCAKRASLVNAIKAKGWCWGSQNANAPFASYTWLKCALDKTKK